MLRKKSWLLPCSVTGLCLGALSFAEGRNSKQVPAQAPVVYGIDNRVDAAFYPNKDIRNLSRSVAARIRKSVVQITGNSIVLPVETLMETMNVCESERFSKQLVASECSGFLAAPNVIVTAGHCVDSQADCESHFWVFDYLDETSEIKNENVYNCKEIISHEVNEANDFAVILLDRVVSDRAPLAIRKSGSLSVADSLMVMGNPAGLPLKIDDGGLLRDPNEGKNFFIAELDTYGGSSGAPVFNLKSYEVEGLLVRGDKDFVWDPQNACAVSNLCTAGTCRGEDVQKILNVKGIPQ